MAGLFDTDPSRVGEQVNGLVIEPVSRLHKVVKQRKIDIGVVAVPASSAQEVADLLVSAGIRSILNFAPTVLRVEDVEVRRVDLSSELQILAHHLAAT